MAALFPMCGKLNESEVVMLYSGCLFLVCGKLNESEVLIMYSGCPIF